MREGESHLIKNAGFLFFQNRIARKPATGPGKVLITLSIIKVHFLMFPFLFNNTLLSSLPNKMEALGIYEVAPEDFAVAEFVDSSKLELQRIVREGLDMLRKENA